MLLGLKQNIQRLETCSILTKHTKPYQAWNNHLIILSEGYKKIQLVSNRSFAPMLTTAKKIVTQVNQ